MADEFVIKGLDEAVSRMQAIPPRVDSEMSRASRVMAAVIVSTVVKGFTKKHRHGTKTTATAGSPPAVVTGNLKSNIQPSVTRKGFGSYLVEVGPTPIYGRTLELGGKNWKSGVNYPFMKPAYESIRERKIMDRLFVQAIRKGLER